MDYFALGGLLLRGSDRGAVIEAHKKLCTKWDITYPLHSSDIRGKRGNFAWLNEKAKYDGFFGDFNALLCEIPVIGFAAVIDRVGYNKRYEEKYGDKRWWMCKNGLFYTG